MNPKTGERKTPDWMTTKVFKEYYGISDSTQRYFRDRGMPYYRIPNSQKILYKRKEVEEWLTSNPQA